MSHETVEPGSIPLHELKQITDDFSEKRRIGRGAYGSVYMGKYKDGRKVAIKILHPMPGFDEEQFEKEFHNLKCLHHQNIVRLTGYCHEASGEFLEHNGETVLARKISMAFCMEYMAKGSLEKHIYDEYNGLNWHTRYKIIKGICSGLQYLHEELKSPFYHLDLKPANILLDEEMEPKIGDFSISKFFTDQQTQTTNACIGTLGYIPPEFIEWKKISSKFDIYSLGVVITKIISGSEGFIKQNAMKSEEFIELVHANWRSRLQKEYMSDEEPYLELVRTCTKIALRCLEHDRYKRPTIGQIVNELNEKESIMQFPQASSIDGGSSIDQVSLCTSTETQTTDAQNSVQEDASEIKESESLKVNPGVLRFPIKPNRWISCALHVTNKTDKTVAFRCVPKTSGLYINDLRHVRGHLGPSCTRTFVATMEKKSSEMDLLDVVVESCMVTNIQCSDVDMYFDILQNEEPGSMMSKESNKYGAVTLTGVYGTVCETIFKTMQQPIQIIYRDAGLGEVFSSDVHPTEPWILIGYSSGSLAIWNYKTQVHSMITRRRINRAHMRW